jgi:hypothetical protein
MLERFLKRLETYATYVKESPVENELTPEQKSKDKRLRTVYKTTLVAQTALLEEQHNSCALCGRPFTEYRAFQDHWHACCHPSKKMTEYCGKCNRGVLCYLCNKYVIGMLEGVATQGKSPIPIIEFCKRILAYFVHWEPILAARGACAKEKTKIATVRKKKKSL